MNSGLNYVDLVSIIDLAISIYNLKLNEEQVSNDEIMEQAQKNEDKLELQNEKYLERIIKQNDEIINLMKGANHEIR